MAKNDKKTPKANARTPEKGPRIGHNPEDTNGQTPVWSIAVFDHAGEWGSSRITQSHLWEAIFAALRNYETMTWGEIYRDKTRNHSVSVGGLCKAARGRLEDIGLDDLDELFRFRLSNTQRVWGIRKGRVFELLWWDPDHEVCPSALKNT